MKIFISHASEDKDRFARPLADALISKRHQVWLDECSLNVGDSLLKEINKGLVECDFGVVVVSPAFLGKSWPENELAALHAKESGLVPPRKVILPVWLDVTADDVRNYSPVLADRFAAKASVAFSK